MDSEKEEDEYNILGGYLPFFVQHLEDTRARLAPQIGSPSHEEQVGAEEGTLSTWTPAEQDAFFRAVSVHSRWRPDLIAACVPTKTEWEVWMYLEVLEEGVAALAAQGGDDEDVEMAVGSSSYSDSDMDQDQGDKDDMHEPALEVSEAWIEAEERMAAWIIEAEHLAEGNVPDTPPPAAKPPKRKRGRPRMVDEDTILYESSPSPSPSPSREASLTPEEKRETLMARLAVPHLQVLDSILREGEAATTDRSKSREGSAATPPTGHEDDGAPRAGSSLSDRISGPPGTNDAPESPSSAVDPALLALSGTVDPTPTFRGAPSQSGTSNTLPQDDATLSNPDAETDLSLLSPRSRRRIQKRLYMRRKRALLRGDGVASEDLGIEKLKPGKKAKPQRNEAPVASTPVPGSEAPSDAEAEVPENVPKKSKKPGLTLPYKLKAQFAEMGVDAAYLRGEGMDLLNLGALGRLIGLYSSLEDDEAGPESIDAQLVCHLQAGMVSFVTDVMHRAIVWRERELRLKERSRVWRHGDQFAIGAVEHAVATIGARQSHKAYFKSIEASHGLASSAPGNATEPNAMETTVDSDVETGDVVPTVSPHRSVYTPLVCPPPSWRTRPLGCLTQTYEREATRTRRGTSAELDDELMSDTTDEEALAAEDGRDGRDMARAEAHEKMLWGMVNK